MTNPPFSGAKLALFLGAGLVVIRRDDRPDIPWPGHWDLPGGGREGHETPAECVLRETREEVGLNLRHTDLRWSNTYLRPRGRVWFFSAHLAESMVSDIRFGAEGTEWQIRSPEDYCADPLAVPHFAEQLRFYMRQPVFRVLLGKTPRS